MRHLILAGAAALVLGAPALAQMAPPVTSNTPPAMAPVTNAALYVAKAGAGDLFEIQSSQLALQKSRDPMVRKFAQQMIADHTKSTAMVKTAATKAMGKAPPPPMLEGKQKAMISDLQMQPAGAAFDGAYWKHQKMAHDEAFKLHSGYAAGGDNADLKMAANKIVPVVKGHIGHVDAHMKM